MERILHRQRLRNDCHIGRLMTPATLRLILDTHRRNPWQRLYLFNWHGGMQDRYGLYDLDLPQRKRMTEETRMGYEESDWFINSCLGTIPADYMRAWSRRVVVREEYGRPDGELATRMVEEERPGYKLILMQLLNEGCIVPSRCLDDWLLDDSRKFAAPELRVRYLEN